MLSIFKREYSFFIDPKLIKDAAGEYHLQKGSPAMDAAKGNYSAVPTDMDGQLRKSPLEVGLTSISIRPAKISNKKVGL